MEGRGELRHTQTHRHTCRILRMIVKELEEYDRVDVEMEVVCEG